MALSSFLTCLCGRAWRMKLNKTENNWFCFLEGFSSSLPLSPSVDTDAHLTHGPPQPAKLTEESKRKWVRFWQTSELNGLAAVPDKTTARRGRAGRSLASSQPPDWRRGARGLQTDSLALSLLRILGNHTWRSSFVYPLKCPWQCLTATAFSHH